MTYVPSETTPGKDDWLCSRCGQVSNSSEPCYDCDRKEREANPIPPPPPAPSRPTRDSSKKSFEREPNRLQNFIQWWWHTKLDSNDRDWLYFLGIMVGAPLFLMVVATGGNILLVSLQMVWAVWLLVVGYRSLRQAITELVDEYQDSIDNPSVQNDDVDRERGTDHTTGW